MQNYERDCRRMLVSIMPAHLLPLWRSICGISRLLIADLCSRRNSDPRGTNCVTMQRLGGCVHAPMNNTCWHRRLVSTALRAKMCQLLAALSSSLLQGEWVQT